MLPLRFDEIDSTDILRSVDNKIAEHKTLEYKERLSFATGDEKAEFLSDISSFANASGGDIIFGISDERDQMGKATGAPSGIAPLNVENPSSECARMEQLIESGIQPRIPRVQIKPLEIPEVGPVIVVRVAKSWIGPHMVSYANRSRFYSRNSSTGKVQLDVQQIGAAFATQRGLGERLRAWKANRIAKAIASDGPVPLQGSQLLFHFISTAALNDEQTLPRTFEQSNWGPSYPLMSLSAETDRYNADGFLTMSKTTTTGRQSYLQIFRDGSLEFGDSYVLEGDQDEEIRGGLLESKILQTFITGISVLKRLEVADPIFVALTLLGVKGRALSLPNYGHDFRKISERFDRDVIVSPDVLIQNLSEGSPYPSTLLPIVNSVWQAAGLAATPRLRQDGTWYSTSP
jgi:Putative DNA-binding domain